MQKLANIGFFESLSQSGCAGSDLSVFNGGGNFSEYDMIQVDKEFNKQFLSDVNYLKKVCQSIIDEIDNPVYDDFGPNMTRETAKYFFNSILFNKILGGSGLAETYARMREYMPVFDPDK